ncbi:hypothetical protein Dda_8298 [Drechslerella dactyloides]|uniref:2',3'-cyclic-nucleotide 3'-phosphodiesterase n=1 Tax=Drechslerella dactyloides TaxID=74499 RepID=A0AAD6NGI3_DREDA|nr:hypothetical protein Dda_8298 [Drechslerella dactyloides]
MFPSLWLLPPPGALSQALQTLISTTLPRRIPGPVPDFQPHITVSSGLPLQSAADFLSLLSSIQLPERLPTILFKRVRYGAAFWTKITLEINKSDSLKDLAVVCRTAVVPGVDEAQAREWVEKYTTPAESGQQGFIPHLSLVYWDEDVHKEEFHAVRLGVHSDVNDAGVKCEDGWKGPDVDGAPVGDMAGWKGGKLVVVDTTKPVEAWKTSILAEREL